MLRQAINMWSAIRKKKKKVDGGSGAGAGGLGAKVTPSAMLVIQNGTTQLINIRNQDSVTKLIDMIPGLIAKVPDLVAKFTGEEPKKEADATSDAYHDLEKK